MRSSSPQFWGNGLAQHPDHYTGLTSQPHAREMDFTGRSMKGMVYIGVEGIAEDADLTDWVTRGTTYARSLPKK